MTRFMIALSPTEADALVALAERERRDTRAQAALSVRWHLEHLGLLPAAGDDPSPFGRLVLPVPHAVTVALVQALDEILAGAPAGTLEDGSIYYDTGCRRLAANLEFRLALRGNPLKVTADHVAAIARGQLGFQVAPAPWAPDELAVVVDAVRLAVRREAWPKLFEHAPVDGQAG